MGLRLDAGTVGMSLTETEKQEGRFTVVSTPAAWHLLKPPEVVRGSSFFTQV